MISLKDNRIVGRMLERLFAALVNGPSLNARPHSSRQRIDLIQLGKLGDLGPEAIFRQLLGEQRACRVIAKIPPPPTGRGRPSAKNGSPVDPPLTPEEKAAVEVYQQQQAVLTKVRSIAEDARVYENDTGVHVLQIGYPLLSLPPGSLGSKSFGRRVLAPLAFVSLSLSARSGPSAAVQMECRNEGADLVQPNVALLAWLEALAGKSVGELDADETGEKPWDEIAQIVARVAGLLDLTVPEAFASGADAQAKLTLKACPRADDDEPASRQPQILSCAVIGLFPLANQGLIRDTQAMLAGEPVEGPVESFVKVGVSLESPAVAAAAPTSGEGDGETQPVQKKLRRFADERLIAAADPCQVRAVKNARTCRGLVVHGPPGTGKSQTISNVIGDHLARGQRVLFVCDKRTALDVVMDRLTAAGLGELCAVVHDPQRDQRDLYRSIREQLDNLTDLRTDAAAERSVARMDEELQSLHAELTDYHTALMLPPPGSAADEGSFHELMGRWLELPALPIEFDDSLLADLTPPQLEAQTRHLHELFERGVACAYPKNPWASAAGVPVGKFLATPMDRYRGAMQACAGRAAAVDETASANIPPFARDEDLSAAAAARAELADAIERIAARFEPAVLKKWTDAGVKVAEHEAARLAGLSAQIALVAQGPLDLELAAALPQEPLPHPPIPTLNQQSAALDAYLATVGTLGGFFAFGKKKAASAVLAVFGLQRSGDNAHRIRDFLQRVKARALLTPVLNHLAGAPATYVQSDEKLLALAADHTELFELLKRVNSDPRLKSAQPAFSASVGSRDAIATFVAGLRASRARAVATVEFETQLASIEIFAGSWQTQVRGDVRGGKPMTPHIAALSAALPTLENVLRIRDGLAHLSAEALRTSAAKLLAQSVSAEDGLTVLRKAALARAIAARLESDPRLHAADSQKLRSAFHKYTQLDAQRAAATRAAVLHLWGSRQKERLLATTGSRLNGDGADLRRRFTLRGERAMRLRQVIAVAQETEGGDPLFDLRPVWMASPETVAQIFPRRPLFDVVIFDEASQCRLEEALPVLLRAKRVVIAGDPKQLPPTRFFESAIVASEDDEIESDQQLFEVQQGEIEDLLGAALNVEIEQCYLDVHYRSRNADLIDFSNRNFYGSRLQPIPGHPSNRARYAPVTLYRADGVYEDRQNEAEAVKVAQIVRDLLRRSNPPSIGVACFNITQRDLILDKLDELSESDQAFARAMAEARTRRVGGAFQGLFVKNLENVQGDERDHIIISTTYGPDPKGKFYRRFGPLGRAGGGRRLNVLVTRARDEVHVVTSIPRSQYLNLPPIPAGAAPGGPWLLFSYLAQAEQLAELYEENHRILSQAQQEQRPSLAVNPTRYPSRFAARFGRELLENHATGSTVHWGNDGFCIDLALHHPRRVEDVTIGVLCDVNRFEQAADPVEWEVFRTMVLQSQNWTLHRLWTPQFFRDPQGCVETIVQAGREMAENEAERDALPVAESGDPTIERT